MRIIFYTIALSLTITTTTAQAGLLGKALKGAALVGAGAMLGRSVSADSPEGKRLKKMNAYVWKALEEHDLNKPNLLQYIQELEVSQNFSMVDTAAYGYALLGKGSKAIEVYDEKMLPYLPLEKESVQDNFNKAYKVLKICVPKTCMASPVGSPYWLLSYPKGKLQVLNVSIWVTKKKSINKTYETYKKTLLINEYLNNLTFIYAMF